MENNFVGEKIVHKTLGDGTIISFDGSYFEISFDEGVKTLKYDYVIDNRLISFNNQNIQNSVYGHHGEEDDYDTIPSDLANIMAKKKLLSKLHEYGFEGFLHTTELINFKRIVSSGYMYSRSLLDMADLRFVNSANRSVLSHTRENIKQCCRFYYYFKTPTNYIAYKNGNYKNPVIMVFDENLIYYEDSMFASSNAAKSYNRITSNAVDALKFPWDGIFERGFYSNSKYVDEGEYYITGIRNAEFLFPHEINIDKIVKVYFKYENDMKQASWVCPQQLKDKFVLDRSKFF